MACANRPYLCPILILGSLALVFHLVGFIAPGWLIMKRDIRIVDIDWEMMAATSEAMMMANMGEQMMHHGGMMPPKEGGERHHDQWHRKPRPEGDSSSEEDGDDMVLKEGIEEDFWGENFEEEKMMSEFERMMDTIAMSYQDVEIKIHYGLWFSRMCVMKPRNPLSSRVRRHDSSSEEDDDKHHGKHHCKKISTQCALSKSYLFEDFTQNVGKNSLSARNMAHASLKEHRIESSIAVALMSLGLLFAICSFRRVDGCRCWAVISLFLLFAAAALIFVPVVRFGSYNRQKCHLGGDVKVHMPYSVIASGLGAFFAMITGFVVLVGLFSKYRKEAPGNWYRFNNELETNKDEKKPSLVFIQEPLPVKAGLYDVCDFSDVKPEEAMAIPEKKPIE